MNWKISKILYSLLIVVLYLTSGIILLLKYLVWQKIPDISLSVFAVFVIIYGLFRGYRGYRAYQKEKEEQNEI